MDETNARCDLLVRVAILLIENGAPAYRIDEALTTLAKPLDLSDVQLVTTPTGFIFEVRSGSDVLTRVRRIRHLGVNMNLLAEVDHLVRLVEKGHVSTTTEIAEQLFYITQQKPQYPAWLRISAVSVACGAFCLLLGGGLMEFTAAVAGAASAMGVRIGLKDSNLLPILMTVAAAFAATAVSTLGCKLLPCTAPQLAPTAAVLLLVPGVPLVTAVVDLTTGNLISGIARGAYGILMTVGIALGILLVLAWGVF